MVDPNRKINRLSDDDAAFLNECESEFRNRYTSDDEEFKEFKEKPSRPPPIVEPWNQHKGDSRGNWNNRNNYRPHNRNNYHRNNDHHTQRQNYRPHYNRAYDRNYRRDGSDNSGYRHGGHGHHGHSNHGHGSTHPY